MSKVAFRNQGVVMHYHEHPRDPTVKEKRYMLVYTTRCRDCKKNNTLQDPFGTRLKGHIYNVTDTGPP